VVFVIVRICTETRGSREFRAWGEEQKKRGGGERKKRKEKKAQARSDFRVFGTSSCAASDILARDLPFFGIFTSQFLLLSSISTVSI
jgi:hypothetical protein